MLKKVIVCTQDEYSTELRMILISNLIKRVSQKFQGPDANWYWEAEGFVLGHFHPSTCLTNNTQVG